MVAHQQRPFSQGQGLAKVLQQEIDRCRSGPALSLIATDGESGRAGITLRRQVIDFAMRACCGHGVDRTAIVTSAKGEFRTLVQQGSPDGRRRARQARAVVRELSRGMVQTNGATQRRAANESCSPTARGGPTMLLASALSRASWLQEGEATVPSSKGWA
ncbi:hypothetical protein HBH71_070890 [Parastagonospora nodorum]|nr:hypothetical protein HBH71_070890 [Parastagonospora nodorum]